MPSKVGLFEETVLLDSKALPWIGEALARLRGQKVRERIFDFEYPRLGVAMKAAAAKVGLSELNIVPYQMRHAGPSHDRLWLLRPLNEVKARGHWASDSSVRRYEAAARLLKEEKRVSEEVLRRGEKALLNLPSQFLGGSSRQKRQLKAASSSKSSRARATSARR